MEDTAAVFDEGGVTPCDLESDGKEVLRAVRRLPATPTYHKYERVMWLHCLCAQRMLDQIGKPKAVAALQDGLIASVEEWVDVMQPDDAATVAQSLADVAAALCNALSGQLASSRWFNHSPDAHSTAYSWDDGCPWTLQVWVPQHAGRLQVGRKSRPAAPLLFDCACDAVGLPLQERVRDRLDGVAAILQPVEYLEYLGDAEWYEHGRADVPRVRRKNRLAESHADTPPPRQPHSSSYSSRTEVVGAERLQTSR